jgi:hypothetical protein
MVWGRLGGREGRNQAVSTHASHAHRRLSASVCHMSIHLLTALFLVRQAYVSIQPRTVGAGVFDMFASSVAAAWPHGDHRFAKAVYPSATMGFVALCCLCQLPEQLDLVVVSARGP